MKTLHRNFAAGLALVALCAGVPANADDAHSVTDPAGDVTALGGAVPAESPRIDILSLDWEQTDSALTFTIRLVDVGGPAPVGFELAASAEVSYDIGAVVGDRGLTAFGTAAPDASSTPFNVTWSSPYGWCSGMASGAMNAADDTVTVTVPYALFDACPEGPMTSGSTVRSAGVNTADRLFAPVYVDHVSTPYPPEG